MIHPGKLSVLAALMGVLLGACGEKHSATAPSAMKVNGVAISTAEVDSKLQQYHISPAQRQSASAGIVKSIVDTELLRQAAVKEKLDKDEMVKAQLSGASRLILASVYLEKKMAAIAKPNESEVKTYYDQHPDRYSDRKVYDLHEVNIEVAPEKMAEISAKIPGGTKSNDFVHWLQEKHIAYNDQPLVVPADKIPDPILQKLSKARGGDIINLPDKGKMTVLFVNHVAPQPVTLAQAAPMIGNQLLSARKSESMSNMLKQLREKAKIEYVPPYSANGVTTSEQ